MPPQSSEILIVGGGVIGLSVARALALRGAKGISLIERGEVGREASFAAAGMLAPQAEADEEDTFFRLASSSRDLYPAFAQALLAETGIDVELDETGTLYLAFTPEDAEDIDKRYQWQQQMGLEVERLSAAQVRMLEPCVSSDVRGALRFPGDIQVENRRLVRALAASCERLGVSMLIQTTVQSLKLEKRKVVGVETSRGFFSAGTVVLAGGAWTSMIEGLPDIRIEPVRGQMLCLKTDAGMNRHVIYTPRGYIVPRRDGRLLAGSTTERVGYDGRVTTSGLHRIRTAAEEISPLIYTLPVIDSWAGLRPRAPDNLPVLGPCGEIDGLVYATGHYRNGILLAPITGELIASAIINKVIPPFINAFSADRFGLVTAN